MRKAVFLLVIFVLAAVSGYLWHVSHGLGTRDAPGSIEAYAARAVRAWSVPGRYKSLANLASCSDDDLQEAREHWADHCATCHANNGNGETMLGKTMYPRPPNMKLPVTQDLTDGELYYVIKNGVRLTGMPAFGEPGDSDKGSWKLVCFIRHLPKITVEEEVAMRALNPKTPQDIEEERQEQEFLNGGAPPASPDHSHH